MKLTTILQNIIKKIEHSVNVENITNSEIDGLFGSASGTSTNAQDYVVEHYQSETEGYTKWASGKCEIWKRITKQLSSTTQWVAPIYYGVYTDNSITYTMNGFNGFVNYPVVQLSLQAVNGNLIGIIGDYSSYTKTGIGNYYVYSVSSQSNISATINVYAVGAWK